MLSEARTTVGPALLQHENYSIIMAPTAPPEAPREPFWSHLASILAAPSLHFQAFFVSSLLRLRRLLHHVFAMLVPFATKPNKTQNLARPRLLFLTRLEQHVQAELLQRRAWFPSFCRFVFAALAAPLAARPRHDSAVRNEAAVFFFQARHRRHKEI